MGLSGGLRVIQTQQRRGGHSALAATQPPGQIGKGCIRSERNQELRPTPDGDAAAAKTLGFERQPILDQVANLNSHGVEHIGNRCAA